MMLRGKAFSNPELVADRNSPPTADYRPRMLMSLTEEDFLHTTRTRYGSIQERTVGRRVSCCVAGEHFLTSNSQEFIKRSLSMDSAVHVDISDINGEGDDPYVPLTLRKCQKKILAPYSCLLSFIGWRPWFKESLSRRCCLWRYFNYLYPLFVIALLFSHYICRVLMCQGIFTSAHIQPATQEMNMAGNCTLGVVRLSLQAKYVTPSMNTTHPHCSHIVPTYIVPSIVHFLAFAYGFYHFRCMECEQLFSLMERVFLQSHSTPGLQSALIRNSRLYFIGALLWVVLQVVFEALYTFLFSRSSYMLPPFHWWCLGLSFAGMVLALCVYVAVAINYCTQCETLILHIKGICLRLHEKSIELKSAMHEILGVREYISQLNGNVAKMMGFCIINFTELTILGTAMLFLNRSLSTKAICYKVIFLLFWLTALIMPLIQAARLTRIGSRLRQISFEMRVFGYQASSLLELDSFVLFVNGATLRSKLFGVTIRSATVILTLGLSAFILLTLLAIDRLTVGYDSLF